MSHRQTSYLVLLRQHVSCFKVDKLIPSYRPRIVQVDQSKTALFVLNVFLAHLLALLLSHSFLDFEVVSQFDVAC